MIAVVPSIIPEDFAQLEREMGLVDLLVPKVQVDVIDGKYAPTTSWPYNGRDREKWERIRAQDDGMPYWETLSFEVDMMVEKPEEHVDDWISAGAETLIIHIESTNKLDEIFSNVISRGAGVALALKPSTPIELLAPVIDKVQFIQCMGNDKIGYHGVELDESVLRKIRDMKTRWPDVILGIDIGVNEETAPKLVEAGVTHLASGSAIYQSGDIAAMIKSLQSLDEH